MRRGDWALGFAGGVALLAAGWGAALPPFRFETAASGGEVDQAPASYEEWSRVVTNDTPLGEVRGDSTDASTIVLTVLAVVLLAVLVAVLVVIVRAVRERWADREPALPPPAPLTDDLPEAVVRDADAHQEALRRGAPSNAIVACWVRLEESLQTAGVRLAATRTSTEVTVDVLARYRVDPDALRRLAALYREARFSRHELAEADREAAAEALGVVHSDLARYAAGVAAGSGS